MTHTMDAILTETPETTTEARGSSQHDPLEFRISAVRALRGPNYWRLAPVIACDVRLGNLEKVSSSQMPGFTDRLLGHLPSLREHPCTKGYRGGFVERLEEGTYIPHILEHVSLELQTLVGADVTFGRVVESGNPGVWWVIVGYEDEDVGIRSTEIAAELVRSCIADTRFDIHATVDELRDLREDVSLGPSTRAIFDEAVRRGIPARRLNAQSLIQLGIGKSLRRVQATVTDFTSSIGVEIAQDKDDTKRVLQNIGLPVPQGGTARKAEEAVKIARDLGYPVIAKPLDASHGRGISGMLETDDAVRHAFENAIQYNHRVLIEKFATGNDHRVLVVNGKVVAVAERVPAHVTGDGRSSVAELIEIGNRDPRRGKGHRKTLTHLPADRATREYLASTGRSLETVPRNGEMVLLRGTANLSTGGTAIDRTCEIHPDNVTSCEMAAGVVGLDIAGIDILTPDISVPLRENGAVIIEVNAGPGVRMHTHPSEGQSRNVAAPILDMLFPPGAPTSIPVIGVTGTNGKTTTTRLIAHLFRNTGKIVGFTTTDGVYLQNRMVREGDMTGPFAANIVLSNPTVEVAVLETARGGILRAGLGFEELDVGIVLNVSADHLGLKGINTIEQLADVKGVVAAVVKRQGQAILNADDPLVYAMRDRTPGDIVLFSLMDEGTNPAFEEHLERNGIGARVEDEFFVIRRGKLRIPVTRVRDVPLMLGGAARFQRGNILAAILAAYVQGMRYDDICAGLQSFSPSTSSTPGRLNLTRVGSTRVLVDYAHNPAAIEGLLELVKELPARRRLGVITAPGDRRDEDIRLIGRLCSGLDKVILKEDENRRGREPGAISALVAEGLIDAGMSEDQIELVPNELDAIARALSIADADDLVTVLADDVSGVVSFIDNLRAERAAADAGAT
ncbi:MAG TPA: cyanophycin synthetase [Gemmatimonadaceae bacterium]|nr:cyanophycin synthetase [Gemmatimonadaceae bacterium]